MLKSTICHSQPSAGLSAAIKSLNPAQLGNPLPLNHPTKVSLAYELAATVQVFQQTLAPQVEAIIMLAPAEAIHMVLAESAPAAVHHNQPTSQTSSFHMAPEPIIFQPGSIQMAALHRGPRTSCVPQRGLVPRAASQWSRAPAFHNEAAQTRGWPLSTEGHGPPAFPQRGLVPGAAPQWSRAPAFHNEAAQKRGLGPTHQAPPEGSLGG